MSQPTPTGPVNIGAAAQASGVLSREASVRHRLRDKVTCTALSSSLV